MDIFEQRRHHLLNSDKDLEVPVGSANSKGLSLTIVLTISILMYVLEGFIVFVIVSLASDSDLNPAASFSIIPLIGTQIIGLITAAILYAISKEKELKTVRMTGFLVILYTITFGLFLV